MCNETLSIVSLMIDVTVFYLVYSILYNILSPLTNKH